MSDDDAPPPTPDELMLELMDLVALAFPEPLSRMRVHFRADPGSARPALTDLDGAARPGQPKRPALGFDEPAVLGSIHEVIGELADATERQGGVRVLTGRLEIEEDEDGARNAYLVRAEGEGEQVVMTRRYDKSELRWLLWTGPLFARLNATEERERAQRVEVEALIAGTTRFAIDLQQGTITFSGDARADVAFDVDLLGSWSSDTRRLLWGFANDQAPERLRRKVEGLRQRSTAWGLRALSEGSFGCPEPCAERLARHAAVELGARGVYRAPFASSQGRGFLYLALTQALSDPQSEKIK